MNNNQSIITQSNILIIKSAYPGIKALEDVLCQNGCNIKSTSKVEPILTSIKENLPDIILLDFCLPDTDGYKVCETLKAKTGFDRIPLVFVCKECDDIDKGKIFSVGGNDYITLPCTAAEILSRIEAQLRLGSLEKQREKLLNEVNGLKAKVFEQKRQLDETTDALKEFNVMLEEEINERTKTEEALSERERQFRQAIEKAPIPIMLHAEDGEVIAINNTWAEITGYTIHDIPTTSKWTEKVQRINGEGASSNSTNTTKLDKKQHDSEYVVRTKDWQVKIWDFYSAYIGKLPDGQQMIMKVALDVTTRKKAEEEIIYLSYHDKLTGLYNRRFHDEEIKRLDTERNLPISIIVGDVNGLKLINDAFGHAKGDQLLQKAATAIRGACRADDIVARWGGDEFVVILPKTKKEEVERIIGRIKELYSNERVNSINVSISFGWATKKKADQDIFNVLKSAEDNMYKTKLIETEGVKGNVINTIVNTLHEKSPREEQHSKRVSEICQSIGIAMGLSEIEIGRLKIAGLLHDIGKIAIEENIFNKPGRLTEQEYNEVKRHPDIGYRILSSSPSMLELAECVLAHHERWDGKGYPKGLKGGEIPIASRIIAIADAFDAMTSYRPYREAMSEEQAIDEICKNSGTQFDPVLAKVFIDKVLNKEMLNGNKN